MNANRLELIAVVLERDALRYTPAGIPVVNCKLHHAADVVETGIPRQVTFEIVGQAVGEISGLIVDLPLGELRQFSGFLARKSRHSKSLVFHITGCKNIVKD